MCPPPICPKSVGKIVPSVKKKGGEKRKKGRKEEKEKEKNKEKKRKGREGRGGEVESVPLRLM